MRAIRFTVSLVVLLLCATAAEAKRVDWNDLRIRWVDHERGLRKAKREGRPIFLLFYADWCPACQQLASWFKDDRVAKASRELVMIRVDVDRQPAISKRYSKKNTIPSGFFLSPEGRIEETMERRSPADLVVAFQRALQRRALPPLLTPPAQGAPEPGQPDGKAAVKERRVEAPPAEAMDRWVGEGATKGGLGLLLWIKVFPGGRLAGSTQIGDDYWMVAGTMTGGNCRLAAERNGEVVVLTGKMTAEGRVEGRFEGSIGGQKQTGSWAAGPAPEGRKSG
jgi:thiol-disulfide isomerase/thioredoxin